MAKKDSYHHGDLRRALLEAGEQELAEKGPEGFTLRGCARRAGVSHAAPAHHFGDAAGLLTALAAEGFARFLATMHRRVGAAGDTPAERLIASGLGYVEFARSNPALFRLMFSSEKPDYQNTDLRHHATAAFDDLVARVGDLTGGDPLSTEAGRHRVGAVWALAHGLADLLMSGQMRFVAEQDEDAVERDLRAILSVTLAAPASG